MAGTYDFEIEQGSIFTRYIYYKDDSTPPVAVNITGYTARLQIREDALSRYAICDLTVGSGLSITGAEGLIIINITADITAKFDFETAVYELRLIPPAGDTAAFALLMGTVTLIKGVVR